MKTAARRAAKASAVRRTVDHSREAADRRASGVGTAPVSAVPWPRVTALATLAAAVSLSAPAAAQTDSWTSPDKALHFGASAPLGMVGASLAGSAATPTQRVLYGTLLGSLPGLAKEVADSRNARADASYKDMAYNIIGAGLGALLADCCLIRPYTRGDKIDGIGIEYKIDF